MRELYALIAYMKDRSSTHSERHTKNRSSTCILGASHTEQFFYMSTRSVTYRTVHLHVYSKRHTNNRSSTCLLGASHTEHFIYILVASYNILLLIRLNCTAHPFLYIFREKSDKDPSHKRVYCTVSVY